MQQRIPEGPTPNSLVFKCIVIVRFQDNWGANGTVKFQPTAEYGLPAKRRCNRLTCLNSLGGNDQKQNAELKWRSTILQCCSPRSKGAPPGADPKPQDTHPHTHSDTPTLYCLLQNGTGGTWNPFPLVHRAIHLKALVAQVNRLKCTAQHAKVMGKRSHWR